MFGHQLAEERIVELINELLSSFENGSKVDIKLNLQELLGESEISQIYPKNIFDKDNDVKEYYVFHDNVISIITRDRMDSKISTHPLKLSAITFHRSNQFEYGDVKLEVKLESGFVLKFDAEQESNKAWNRTYSQFIKEIHAMLVAKM